jgi:hypothetical protein
MNMADGAVTGLNGNPALGLPDSAGALPLPSAWRPALRAGMPLTLGVRPEHIMVKPAGEAAGLLPLGEWAVTAAEPYGPATLLTVTRPGLTWFAWQTGPPAGVDQTVSLTVPEDRCHGFDGITGERLEGERGA